MTAHRWLLAALALGRLVGACGGPPVPPPGPRPAPVVARRSADVPDDCEQIAGQPPPEPLRREYTGVAKSAKCQRAVYTIMGGLTHFLGVECRHCHLEPDYAADTHNKQIANWMARELVPRLQKREREAGGNAEVWCQDCHAARPKLLGNPRRRDVAIEWMTTHLVDDFQTLAGKPPKCRDCHGGDLGSPEFRPKIILSELSGLPAPSSASTASALPEVPPPEAAPTGDDSAPSLAPSPSAAPASPSAAPSSSSAPIPDFGQR